MRRAANARQVDGMVRCEGMGRGGLGFIRLNAKGTKWKEGRENLTGTTESRPNTY